MLMWKRNRPQRHSTPPISAPLSQKRAREPRTTRIAGPFGFVVARTRCIRRRGRGQYGDRRSAGKPGRRSFRRLDLLMRVLIFTFGTRGDVEPFAALAQRLTAAGHTAVLAAPEPYRATVAADVGFEPMATEMDRVMRAGMTRLLGPAHALTLAREMAQGMRVSLREQWQIAQRVQPTVIVGHPKALGGLHVAERLGVPFVASLPLPFLTPTSAFPIPFMTRQLPGSLNRITYDFNRFTALAYGGMINKFRRATLGLPRMSRRTRLPHHSRGHRRPCAVSVQPPCRTGPRRLPLLRSRHGLLVRREPASLGISARPGRVPRRGSPGHLPRVRQHGLRRQSRRPQPSSPRGSQRGRGPGGGVHRLGCPGHRAE